MTVLLLLELLTLAFTALAGLHAWSTRRGEGLGAYLGLLALGGLRENYVVIERLLYGYGDLRLALGRMPVVGAVIWAYSIWAALVWAERVGGERWSFRTLPSWRLLALVALFMDALACFYEPFLARFAMARWEAGTQTTLGVPWIALVGYATLAVAWLWSAPALRRVTGGGWRFALAMTLWTPLLAVGHARGLAALKHALGW